MPARTPPPAADSIPANANTRSSTAGAPPVVAPPARPDTAIPDSLTQREIELQAIRDELARRTARLDSMGRALGSLYVAPRRPAPGVPLRPPPPPPSFRDPRS
jgi:hypothetical protein